MKKKMTKKAATEIGRGVVSKIRSRGGQYFFNTPHDLNDLSFGRYSVEIKDDDYNRIRRRRTERINAIVKFLMK